MENEFELSDQPKRARSKKAAADAKPSDPKSVVERWYTNKLNDPVSRSSEAAGEQVLEAVVVLPGLIAEANGSIDSRDAAIDKWFVEFFHKPPVSEDTRLYNTLHAAKEELKAMLSANT